MRNDKVVRAFLSVRREAKHHQTRWMSFRYAALSREELEDRLGALEAHASSSRTKLPPPVVNASQFKKKAQKAPARAFNFNAYPKRHVALLVAYQGWPYSGLAIQPDVGDITTVEGELLKALEKTRLIEEGKGWDGCGFSRCGRTDSGVSGAGQVVNLWVRSNRKKGDGGDLPSAWKDATEPLPPKPPKAPNGESSEQQDQDSIVPAMGPAKEFAYPRILNNVLPPDIRVLAWSPVEVHFDSRFSCQFRHYKYAFHRISSPGQSPLNLDAMRGAADLLLGEHDFRNFCKPDGSKQIENHRRRVLKAWFEEDNEQVVFNLVGTAFLWHQVRHIMGVLFLVGAGLEQPVIVKQLLEIETIPAKPLYVMAAALPLRLHECGYEERELDWRVGENDGPMSAVSKEIANLETKALASLRMELEAARQEMEIKSWQITGALHRLDEVFGRGPSSEDRLYPLGGGDVSRVKNYKPLLQLHRGETVEEINRKWREGKGQLRLARQGDDPSK